MTNIPDISAQVNKYYLKGHDYVQYNKSNHLNGTVFIN